MDFSFVHGLLLLLIQDTTLGQLTDCACYGNDVTIDSIMPNCTSSNGIILIDSVYRAAKRQSTGCPNIVDDSNRDETNCCTYDSGTDCRIALTPSDVPTIYSDCSGKSACSKQVTWQSTASHCSGTYMTETNFMCTDYNCIPSSDSLNFCDTSGIELATTTSYFYNDGYPSGISHFNCCACVVTASAASATIDLELLDLQLFDETSSCLQTLFIQDGTGLVSYNCTHNNDYVIQTLLTSNGSSVTVTLKSGSSATGNGRAWLRATVSNGGMITSCGAITACPDEIPTTPSSPNDAQNGVTQTSGTDTTTNSSKESWLFGLSVTVSAIFMAGLFVIILLLFLLCCVICYNWGKSKSFPVTKETPRGSPEMYSTRLDNARDNSTKTGVQSMNTTDLHVPRSYMEHVVPTSGSQKNGVFVYRPFENGYTLRSYIRRQSLVRVESP